MKSLQGIPVSPGYAEGTAYVYRQDANGEIPRYQIGSAEVEPERQRFHQAMERCAEELKVLRDRVSRGASKPTRAGRPKTYHLSAPEPTRLCQAV